MLKRIIKTQNDWAITILRITLGVVMLPHGAQKMLGWFGGYGFTGTMDFFTQQMGIPSGLAFLAILAESAGSLGLIFGFLTRIAAFGIGTVMTVAIFAVHLPNGFFMNWAGTQVGEGFEYHLLALGLASSIIILGGGAASIDQKISSRLS